MINKSSRAFFSPLKQFRRTATRYDKLAAVAFMKVMINAADRAARQAFFTEL